jgi:hypothetical protein
MTWQPIELPDSDEELEDYEHWVTTTWDHGSYRGTTVEPCDCEAGRDHTEYVESWEMAP